jgi:hypothetical protein
MATTTLAADLADVLTELQRRLSRRTFRGARKARRRVLSLGDLLELARDAAAPAVASAASERSPEDVAHLEVLLRDAHKTLVRRLVCGRAFGLRPTAGHEREAHERFPPPPPGVDLLALVVAVWDICGFTDKYVVEQLMREGRLDDAVAAARLRDQLEMALRGMPVRREAPRGVEVLRWIVAAL